LFCWDANGLSPGCAGRRSRWRSSAGSCWPIVSRRSWRHSRCTCRRWPLSLELLRGKHL
jgi:hypothetical protein